MTSEVGTVNKEKMIQLKPVVRSNWLPKGHDGEHRFTGCEVWEAPPKDGKTGQRQTGLSETDERRLEIAMRLSPNTLNKYNEDFWSKYWIRIPKEGRTFYLDNPKDELDVLVLKANPRIANSQMEIIDSPGASHFFSSVEAEAVVENAKANVERQAIKHFGKLSTSGMIDILKVMALSRGGKDSFKVSNATSTDVIENTLYNKLKQDPEEFIRIVEDPYFKTKVLIDKLVTARILLKSGSKYVVHGGDAIGGTLQDTIDYLEDAHNQDVLIALKSKLEATE